MIKGDIILIPFPFTDLTSSKLRPAIILISTDYDVTVSFISTQLKWINSTDIQIKPSNKNGIKKESIIKLSKIATIDKALALGKIGELDQLTLLDLNIKLKILLQLY